MEFTGTLNKKMMHALCKTIHVEKEHVFRSEVPLDLSFVFAIQSYLKNTNAGELFYPRRTPRMQRGEGVKDEKELLTGEDLNFHEEYLSLATLEWGSLPSFVGQRNS